MVSVIYLHLSCIFLACAQVAGVTLPYDTREGVRRRLAEVAPHMAHAGTVESPLWLNGEYFKVRRLASTAGTALG